jgi:hypothetical protein
VEGKTLSEEHIAWHPAFVEAIQAELEEYKDVLEFHPEYPLTTEPLRIDVLVVRKRSDVVIKKNIARIFREHNIIEYKSPGDYVSRADFQKVQAYAWLYASVQNLPTQNLTITLVESGYSRNVFHHLKTDLGYDVEESEAGIYVVKGLPMPVQIIESKKLDARENMWLKNLREPTDAASFAEMLRVVQNRGKEAPLKAYAHVLLTAATIDVMKEVRKMATTMELFEVFRDVVGFDEEWEKRIMEIGRDEGRNEERMTMAKNLLARGVDPVIIAESSGLALDKIRKIAAEP